MEDGVPKDRSRRHPLGLSRGQTETRTLKRFRFPERDAPVFIRRSRETSARVVQPLEGLLSYFGG